MTREEQIKELMKDVDMDTFQKLRAMSRIADTNIRQVSHISKKLYGVGRYFTLRNWMTKEPMQFKMYRSAVLVMLERAKKLDVKDESQTTK